MVKKKKNCFEKRAILSFYKQQSVIIYDAPQITDRDRHSSYLGMKAHFGSYQVSANDLNIQKTTYPRVLWVENLEPQSQSENTRALPSIQKTGQQLLVLEPEILRFQIKLL